MDTDDVTYRDILSAAEQGMIDNGPYVLVNERDEAVHLDEALPDWDEQKASRGELPVFRFRLRPFELPSIWIGHYQDLQRMPLFCFFTGDPNTATELEKPIDCFMEGGFTVARFADEAKLMKALEDPGYTKPFDMIGLIADAAGSIPFGRCVKA